MPTTSIIRESLTTLQDIAPTGLEPFVLMKRINLQSKVRKRLNHMDWFDDVGFSNLAFDAAFQFYVSVYPIAPTQMDWGQDWLKSGPDASSDNVLMKVSGSYISSTSEKSTFFEFPSEALKDDPTFTFYSDHVYLTALIWTATGSDTDLLTGYRNSVYLQVEETAVGFVEYGLGVYVERKNANLIEALVNHELGGMITAAEIAGDWFPTWLMGGTRPSFMLNAGTIASFFQSEPVGSPEKMIDRANYNIFYDEASQMVDFDDPFGGDDVAKDNIPDWITLVDNKGLRDEVLPNFPPVKKNDVGLTVFV